MINKAAFSNSYVVVCDCYNFVFCMPFSCPYYKESSTRVYGQSAEYLPGIRVLLHGECL